MQCPLSSRSPLDSSTWNSSSALARAESSAFSSFTLRATGAAAVLETALRVMGTGAGAPVAPCTSQASCLEALKSLLQSIRAFAHQRCGRMQRARSRAPCTCALGANQSVLCSPLRGRSKQATHIYIKLTPPMSPKTCTGQNSTLQKSVCVRHLQAWQLNAGAAERSPAPIGPWRQLFVPFVM